MATVAMPGGDASSGTAAPNMRRRSAKRKVTGGSPATDADYRAVTDPGALTMTATGKKTFSFRCGGWKHARVLVQGTGGDYTGSSVAVSFRYLTRVGV